MSNPDNKQNICDIEILGNINYESDDDKPLKKQKTKTDAINYKFYTFEELPAKRAFIQIKYGRLRIMCSYNFEEIELKKIDELIMAMKLNKIYKLNFELDSWIATNDGLTTFNRCDVEQGFTDVDVPNEYCIRAFEKLFNC
jgi:hypothetical protein